MPGATTGCGDGISGAAGGRVGRPHEPQNCAPGFSDAPHAAQILGPASMPTPYLSRILAAKLVIAHNSRPIGMVEPGGLSL